MKLLLSAGIIGGIVAGVILLIIIIIAVWAISTHNKLIVLKTKTDEAFSTIDVSLKKRFDLIPNVVNTVKGYAKHESETLTQVIQARTAARTTADKIKADNELTHIIRGFNRLEERYPELKANSNFMALQSQLASMETELSQARRYFNGTVREFNIKIQVFPSSIIAKFMKLTALPMFEITNEAERENVKVEF